MERNSLSLDQRFELIAVLNEKDSFSSIKEAAQYASEKLGMRITIFNIQSLEKHIKAKIMKRERVAKPNVGDLSTKIDRVEERWRDAFKKVLDRLKDAEARVSHLEKQLGVEPPVYVG